MIRPIQEEVEKIAKAVNEALDRKKMRQAHAADAAGIHRSQMTRLSKGQRGLSGENFIQLFRVLSITEADLKLHGVSECTIRSIFEFEKQRIIFPDLTKVEGAWIYKRIDGELVFAHGSPRTLIKKKILEDISNRLELFFDQNNI